MSRKMEIGVIGKTMANRMGRITSRKGFTLVELSLSLVFISILSLAVVMVMAGAISSYHKSITMNDVNTVGTGLVDDMRLSVQDSPGVKLATICDAVFGSSNSGERVKCVENGAKNFISVARNASINKKNGETIINSAPVFGAFCTGTYSYIWNSGYLFNNDYMVGVDKASLKYNYNGTTNLVSGFKLLKVEDKNRAVCVAAIQVRNGAVNRKYNSDSIDAVFDITAKGLLQDGEVTVEEEAVELINEGENGLALYDLSSAVSEQLGTAKNAYYYTSFILGTVQGGINVNAGTCATPEGYSAVEGNFDYCAINKFNFAALANGKWRS